MAVYDVSYRREKVIDQSLKTLFFCQYEEIVHFFKNY